jgi:hypothetical protein
MNTLIKFANLSDKSRWDVENYHYPWVEDLSENDKGIIKSLKYIGEGELSGLGVSLLFNKLLMESDIPPELIGDFAQIEIFSNIITYEEFRHGLIFSSLNEANFINNIDDREFGNKYIYKGLESKIWNAYGLLLSLCISEATNTFLYSSIAGKIESSDLKTLLNKIQKDEARHLATWKEIIKELANSHPYHMDSLLSQLHESINNHNALLADNFPKGLVETMGMFPMNSLSEMVKKKHQVLEYIFEDKNPLSLKALKLSQVKFLKEMMNEVK